MAKDKTFEMNMTAFELLCYLTCNCYDPAHLHENIAKLLDHWEQIPKGDRVTARKFVLERGNDEQKKRVSKLR